MYQSAGGGKSGEARGAESDGAMAELQLRDKDNEIGKLREENAELRAELERVRTAGADGAALEVTEALLERPFEAGVLRCTLTTLLCLRTCNLRPPYLRTLRSTVSSAKASAYWSGWRSWPLSVYAL